MPYVILLTYSHWSMFRVAMNLVIVCLRNCKPLSIVPTCISSCGLRVITFIGDYLFHSIKHKIGIKKNIF